MGLLALGLGLLVVTGLVQLWHVYVFAFLLGCTAAFDAPARQTFVTELVEEPLLPNAVALNSTSFNAARMIGPAIAGGVIAAVGSGYVFLINALSFLAVLSSLTLLRPDKPGLRHRASASGSGFADGFRYVLGRPDLKVILSMLFLAVGLAAQTFTTSTNSLTQMSTEPRMRGRVIALLLAIALGGTPIGAPIAG